MNTCKFEGAKIKDASGLTMVEAKYHIFRDSEYFPYAKDTSYKYLAEVVVPDRDGFWVNPLYIFKAYEETTVGLQQFCKLMEEFLYAYGKENVDLLSISYGIVEKKLCVVALMRCYNGLEPAFKNLHPFILSRVSAAQESHDDEVPSDTVSETDDLTEEELESHKKKVEEQKKQLLEATEELPFLNRISHYEKLEPVPKTAQDELIYDLLTKDMKINTILPYREFISIFTQCMSYITSVERDNYYIALKDRKARDSFKNVIHSYIDRNFLSANLISVEDLPALYDKLNRALFQLYIVQDLIDDPEITDIKITAYDSIRVRIKGKAYLSNVTFIDNNDYLRFMASLTAKNDNDTTLPTQTFTDDSDPAYILRFTLTSGYITASGDPTIHIRKVSRKKLLSKDLLDAGMFDEKIRDYLLDCGKNSRGVVFAGPPGSGKTVLLNWFLEEAYENSAEILVIQENDELFSYRKGIMFEHVVTNPSRDEKECSLEQLGQLALVAGANVFVIGEAKGGEICSAITLSNSGCRTALTIHSPSSTETIDKMADLAMRGYATSYRQAKRMIKSFQTIVYLSDFKVQEISEIIGYDDDREDMIYRPIYRRI